MTVYTSITPQITQFTTVTVTTTNGLPQPTARRRRSQQNAPNPKISNQAISIGLWDIWQFKYDIISDACLLYLYKTLQYPTKIITALPQKTNSKTIEQFTTVPTQQQVIGTTTVTSTVSLTVTLLDDVVTTVKTEIQPTQTTTVKETSAVTQTNTQTQEVTLPDRTITTTQTNIQPTQTITQVVTVTDFTTNFQTQTSFPPEKIETTTITVEEPTQTVTSIATATSTVSLGIGCQSDMIRTLVGCNSCVSNTTYSVEDTIKTNPNVTSFFDYIGKTDSFTLLDTNLVPSNGYLLSAYGASGAGGYSAWDPTIFIPGGRGSVSQRMSDGSVTQYNVLVGPQGFVDGPKTGSYRYPGGVFIGGRGYYAGGYGTAIQRVGGYPLNAVAGGGGGGAGFASYASNPSSGKCFFFIFLFFICIFLTFSYGYRCYIPWRRCRTNRRRA